MIDQRARISRILRYLYYKKIRRRFWIYIALIPLLLHATVYAQGDADGYNTGESAVDENRAEPSGTAQQTDQTESFASSTIDQSDIGRTDLTLSDFLFAIRVGPFFSFGLWTGVLGEIEFEFKLHDHGYLSLVTGINGGYQIDFERGDFLFSEALGYRSYLPSSPGQAWTLFGGFSFGYFTTTQGQSERSYDWLHVGLKVKGGYYFFTNETLSVGVDIGFTLAYQLDEFVDEDDFLVVVPDLTVALLF